MTQEQLKQIINSLEASPELKQRLEVLLSRLGKYSTNGLIVYLDKRENLSILGDIVDAWEKLASLFEALKKGESSAKQSFFKVLEEIRNGFNDEDKLDSLSFVLDVRVLVVSGKLNFSPEEFNKLLDYEASLFWLLPREEVTFLLQNYILYLVDGINLIQDVQAVVFDAGWHYSDNFSRQFTDILLKNREDLAGKAVADWIKSFSDSTPAPLAQRNTLQIGVFLTKDSQASKLGAGEKKALSEILKLFLWFNNPEMNEDAIYAYKKDVRTAEGQRYKELYLQETVKNVPDVSDVVERSVVVEQGVQVPVESEIKPAPVVVADVKKLEPAPVPPAKPVPLRPASYRDTAVNVQEILKRNVEQKFDLSAGGLKNIPKRLNDIVPTKGFTKVAPVPVLEKPANVDIDSKLNELKNRGNSLK